MDKIDLAVEGKRRGVPDRAMAKYVQLRIKGQSPNMAEMIALREGPAGTVKGSSTPCAKRSHNA